MTLHYIWQYGRTGVIFIKMYIFCFSHRCEMTLNVKLLNSCFKCLYRLCSKMFLLCSLAAQLARAHSAPPPPAGSRAPSLLLPALHAPNGQALQEKPGPDQLPGTSSWPWDGDFSKPSRAESRGCVKAKAAAHARPTARAGEKHRDTRLPGHSGFWNAVVQRAPMVRCVVADHVYVLVLQVIFEQVPQMKRNFREHENVCYSWSQEVTVSCFHICW